MHGQFFILGAILLAVMFFIGLPLIKPLLSSPSSDLSYLSSNIYSEFPVALNLGLNQSDELRVLKNFTSFVNETLYDHFVRFSSLWIYAKNSSTNVNFTVGNYLNMNTTINLTISSTETQFFVENNKTNSTLFTSPGTIFNLTIEFQSQTTTVEFLRDKVNLYVFYELKRGNDLIRKDIIA